MSGGKHSRTVRQLRRRIEVVLEEEQALRKPPPPPVSQAHEAIRDQIERAMGEVHKRVPEGMDLEEALDQNPELATSGARIIGLIREEQDFLASQGVDPRPYDRYEPRF